jgi:chromosome segregation ATPase
MEEIIKQMAVLGVSEGAFTTIILAFIGLLGTFATVGYKYQSNKVKPESDQKVLFDQVNEFIKTQKEDRDALRKELADLRDELTEVRNDNEAKDRKINSLVREIAKRDKIVRDLQKQIDTLSDDAKLVAATKVQEDKEKE